MNGIATFFSMIALISWAQTPSASDAGHIAFGCNIYTAKGLFVKKLPGNRCSYLPDGRFVVHSQMDLKMYSNEGVLVWKKSINAHHSTRLDLNQNYILVLSSSFHEEKGTDNKKTRVRYDRISIFDFNGNEVRNFDFYKHRDALKLLTPDAFKNYRGPTIIDLQKPNSVSKPTFVEASHANSIYPIPSNPLAKDNSAFKEGNYIVNVNGPGLIFILDKNLEKIVWSISHLKLLGIKEPNAVAALHDVQITSEGKLLIYNNLFKKDASAIEEIDPLTLKRKTIYSATSPEIFFARTQGGVQKLKDNKYLVTEISIDDPKPRPPRIFEVQSGKINWSIVAMEGGPSGWAAGGLQDARILDLTDFLKNNKFD